MGRQSIPTSAIKTIEQIDVITVWSEQASLEGGHLRKDQKAEKGVRHEKVWGVSILGRVKGKSIKPWGGKVLDKCWLSVA